MFLKSKYSILSSLVLSFLALSSCSEEEFDKWEVIRAESVCSIADGSTISYEATVFWVDIKSNGSWTVSLPSWMSTDRTEGIGDARLPVKIATNETNKQRTGTVKVTSGNATEPLENVVGSAVFSTKIIQQAKYQAVDIKVTSANVVRKGYNYNSIGKYYDYCIYSISITYDIESDLSDEEIAEVIRGLSMKIKMSGTRPATSITDPGYYTYNVYTSESLPITRGTHTVEMTEKIYYYFGIHTGADVIPTYYLVQDNQQVEYKEGYCRASFQFLK